MASMPQLLDATAREGQRFCHDLFSDIDSRGKVPQPITPGTTIVWNGTPLVGPEAFTEMVNQSPAMRHTISGLDVQPFPNGDAHALNMLVNTSGKVGIGTAREDVFAFSAQLVVRRTQPGTRPILQTMAYRLVHKPTNATIKV